jgi:DNA-binding NarL/FixJ family response regulator
VNRKTRLVLADDHPIVLGGLRHLIEAEDDLVIVGEAGSGLAALDLIRETSPDVAIVDISMPGLNGIALTRRLRSECPSVRVLTLTFHEDRAYVSQARLAGIRGYVLKRSAAESLIYAIRVVRAGGFFLDPAVTDHAPVSRPRGPQPGKIKHEITEREAEVIKLVALGFANKEIATQLDVGVKSVETYKARAAEKLGLRSRADIVRASHPGKVGWRAAERPPSENCGGRGALRVRIFLTGNKVNSR